jgi:hypothetical protein
MLVNESIIFVSRKDAETQRVRGKKKGIFDFHTSI